MRHPSGVPCLTVREIDKAVWYYRRFFGFVAVGQDPDGATLHGHGTELRLRRSPTGWDGARGSGLPIPDALILVRQPELLRRRLDDWGAHLVPTEELGRGWEGCYGLRDCYGNVIAVGPTSGVAAVGRRVAEPADGVRRFLSERATTRAETRQAAAFRDFYQRLPDHRNIVYLHFTGGLLHWVVKTAGYLPDHINLVLIGSGLPPSERAWVREQLHRPFHHVDLRLDDAGALELLFATNRTHFGWLELGCLVLDGRLFDELAVMHPDTSLNCTWSWEPGFGFPLANPYLLFVSVDAIARVRDAGLAVGPGIYAYRRRNRQVEGRRCYTRTPSRAVRRRLGQLLPADDAGLPRIPGDLATFETTMLYQLVARACGLRVHKVRSLTGFNHIQGGQVQDDSSDELLYIGGLGRADVLEEFSGYFHDVDVRIRYAIAEFLTLAPVAADLPAGYQERLDRVTALLAGHGLGADAVEQACREHLIGVRGLSRAAANAVIQPPAGLSQVIGSASGSK